MEGQEWEPTASRVVDKWDGEDEEEDVKDNWDDDEEEKQTSTSDDKPATEATKIKKNKRLQQKLAEKEQQELEERLERMEPELRAREILLEQKRREDAELQLAKEAFGGGLQSINTGDPQTKDDFDELRKNIIQDLNKFEKRAAYPDFIEDLVQDLCLNLETKRLRKIKTMVEALNIEKAKLERAKTKAPAGKAKAKLNVGNDKTILASYGGDDLADDYDDFM